MSRHSTRGFAEMSEPEISTVAESRPRRAADEDERLVLRIGAALGDRLYVDTTKIAYDIAKLPSVVQKRFAEICFNIIGLWSEFEVGPEHPLAHEYDTARRMVRALFDKEK